VLSNNVAPDLDWTAVAHSLLSCALAFILCAQYEIVRTNMYILRLPSLRWALSWAYDEAEQPYYSSHHRDGLETSTTTRRQRCSVCFCEILKKMTGTAQCSLIPAQVHKGERKEMGPCVWGARVVAAAAIVMARAADGQTSAVCTNTTVGSG
jgi:hypothetical protein